ncbi:Zn-dependent hydrolase [Neobacillus sp. NPDC093182]|uniref:Zn-dependent hydrolase n=1 Tax=Neobacillus sp. NPDC093182 TaxID=3364297 RepID=UPI0037F32689
MINQDRIWDRLFKLSKIGKQKDGGITRLSFTKQERKAKDLVISFMKEAGLAIREDEVGNLIGRKEGRNINDPVVIIGSHLDSVPNGGNFDGPLGIIAGIEVLQTMNEKGIIPDHPIEVIAFTDEEGTRFGLGMIGSRGIAGTLNNEQLQKEDEHGISISEAMKRVGLDPNNISRATRVKGSIKAYIELHIEQGKVLESENLPVGIVSGIAGPLWNKWTLMGEAAHAGSTPMQIRKDPLVAAAIILQFIEEEVKKHKNAVGTVGKILVKPGGVNVIPGLVEFTFDLREIDEKVRDEIEQNIISKANKICQERGIELFIEDLQRVAPAICSKEIQEIIENSCQKNEVHPFILPSGAGHDGMQLHPICPIGMIFVRSKNGISHNPEEWSSKEDCGISAIVLYHSILQLSDKKINFIC